MTHVHDKILCEVYIEQLIPHHFIQGTDYTLHFVKSSHMNLYVYVYVNTHRYICI